MKKFPAFSEPEISVLCSQEPATGPRPEPSKSGGHSCLFPLKEGINNKQTNILYYIIIYNIYIWSNSYVICRPIYNTLGRLAVTSHSALAEEE